MSRIKQLRQRKADLVKEADALVAKKDAKTISPEEQTRLAAILADGGELAEVNADIVQEERLMDERRSMAAVTDINADTETERTDRIPANARREPDRFASFGEFLRAVAAAGQPGIHASQWDRRLTYQPPGSRPPVVPGCRKPSPRRAASWCSRITPRSCTTPCSNRARSCLACVGCRFRRTPTGW